MQRQKIVFLDCHTLATTTDAFAPIKNLGELVLYDRTAPDLVPERAVDAGIILTNKAVISAETLAECTRLKLICVTATGFNVVDVVAAAARAIPVCNVPEYGTNTVAEHTIALMLELARRVGDHDRSVHAGDWVQSPDWSYTTRPLVELHGKKLGVIGYGRIGRRVAEIAAVLGMDVVACTRSGGTSNAAPGVRWASQDEIFATSDVVSLHCPLTDQTRHMVNGTRLRQMKPTAFLINCSRGGLIDEKALTEALDQGLIAGAALDVVSDEPVRADNPLLKARNCILTPHVAWATTAAKSRLIDAAAANIAAFLTGRPTNVVNAEFPGLR